MWHCVAMNKPKIVAYLKPTCGWSQGVRAVLKKYDLPYEDRDVINDPLQRQEMIEKSGQMLSPCVEINGQMLPDISGEEVEAWMLANKIVTPNDRARRADQPALRPRNAAEFAAEFRRAPVKIILSHKPRWKNPARFLFLTRNPWFLN
jgi:glutaredoxin